MTPPSLVFLEKMIPGIAEALGKVETRVIKASWRMSSQNATTED